MRYLFSEQQNLQSHRESFEIEAKNRTQAKRIASRRKAFTGTVLVLRCNGAAVAYKEDGKRWKDVD